MARKRMKPKIQPAVMKIALSAPAGASYVDLSQCASILNRRFYRQGLNWAVSHFTVYKPTPTESGASAVAIHKLPDTWVMSNAWEKGFRAWQHMIKNATDETQMQSLKGKFLDFKIFANAGHHTAGVSANLLPYDSSNNQANRGQWDMSTVELNAGPGFPAQSFPYELVAVGPNPAAAGASGLNAKSLINGYSVSRALPYNQDPNVPADADSTAENWILSIFNEGTTQDEEVVEMLQSTGDQAPYPYEGDGTNIDTMYPGGQTQLPALQIHDAGYFNAGTNANKLTLEGGTFPCGLMEIVSSEACTILITLVPGSHRGYLAESMTEM